LFSEYVSISTRAGARGLAPGARIVVGKISGLTLKSVASVLNRIGLSGLLMYRRAVWGRTPAEVTFEGSNLIQGISHGSLGDMFPVWYPGVDGRL